MPHSFLDIETYIYVDALRQPLSQRTGGPGVKSRVETTVAA